MRKPFDHSDFNHAKDIFKNIHVEDDELTFKLSQTDIISESSIGTKEELLLGEPADVPDRQPSMQLTNNFPPSQSMNFQAPNIG